MTRCAAPPAETVASIGCPLRGFYGEQDARIVTGLPEFEASRDAWARTLACFAAELGGSPPGD